MVPVVRFTRGDAARHCVCDDGEELLPPRVGWITEFHERDRIDARVRVTPIGFETPEVRTDCVVEQSARQVTLTAAQRDVPSIFVDSSQDAVGLATGTTVLQQLFEHLLRI